MNGEPFTPEEQEQDVLKRSRSLRMPVFEKGKSPKDKISALEDYMLLTAYVQGALSAEKDRVEDTLAKVEDDWENLRGDSYHLGKATTEKNLERERREENAGLWGRRRDLRTRVRRLNEEIARMERDAKVCSRTYTFLTGT